MPIIPRASRNVDAVEPGLSRRTNTALGRELRQAVGTDSITEEDWAAADIAVPRRLHSRLVADLIDLRLGLVIGALALLLVGAVIAVNAGGTLVLVGALLVLAVATGLVLRMSTRLASEEEHPGGETAAALQAEGVGDPDRLLSDLVAEARREHHRAA